MSAALSSVLARKAPTCKVATCGGYRASRDGHGRGPCPEKSRPYQAPARAASPEKKAVHAHVAMLVTEIRQALEHLQAAVEYEGTEYGEMGGDLRETAERIDE